MKEKTNRKKIVARCVECKSEFTSFISDGNCPECEGEIILFAFPEEAQNGSSGGHGNSGLSSDHSRRIVIIQDSKEAKSEVSSFDWKEEFIGDLRVSFPEIYSKYRLQKNADAYLLGKIENLIEAAREESYREGALNVKGEDYIAGRAAEREEQNRIHNSGRKLYKIGYAEALGAVAIQINEIPACFTIGGGIPMLPKHSVLARLSALKEKQE